MAGLGAGHTVRADTKVKSDFLKSDFFFVRGHGHTVSVFVRGHAKVKFDFVFF